MDIGIVGRRWFVSAAALTFVVPACVLLGGSQATARSSPAALPVAELTAVAATSVDNAWAVGWTANGTPHPVILHWNGKSWARTVVPPVRFGGVLNGVTAISARNAWAVGETVYQRLLILHWNGARWFRVSNPANPKYGILNGVAGTSPSDVWAVGGLPSIGFGGGELILHWNGKVWRQVHVPNLYPGSGIVNGVTALSPTNAWAVGYTGIQGSIFHWNGKVWRRSKVTLPRDGNSLAGISAWSAGDVWAVGGSSYNLSLILR